MEKEIAVKFDHVDKIYKLDSKKRKRFEKKKSFYALKDVSFEIEKGCVVGILGSNGSGKSTLSNILAGISMQDHGKITIHGEQALIAIQAGLNTQLSGIENIRLKGALLGLSKKKIEAITQGVIDFAELGEFLYQPVKKYSSGMKSRLGFSISICLDPEIIIVDEALSVGDKGFAAKCLKKMNELKASGKTIFFISHSISQVRGFCEKGLWIEGGRLREYGDIQEVADHYEEYIDSFKKMSAKEVKQLKAEVFESRILK
ncbi:MAG: ATP-binding cassette domain-containing protein [Erysipelotrichia bacterium]|nr:ATP-binding cassette domain-containing protein [Erysipelotrichia bacterium]NCC54253.1 ATP-binding cassette domain-containing protein [Erysipelotrichia bacterium]